MQIGDRVFVSRSSSWNMRYMPGKVFKITPSGMVDILINGSMAPTRFRNGREIGGSFLGYFLVLDHLPYEEREALIAKEDRAKAAAAAINAIKPEERVQHTWSKELMVEEVLKLQMKLDEAKNAVDTI